MPSWTGLWSLDSVFCVPLHWIWRGSTCSPIAPVSRWHRDYPRRVTGTLCSPLLSYGDFMWKMSYCKCYPRPQGGGAMYCLKPAPLSVVLRYHVQAARLRGIGCCWCLGDDPPQTWLDGNIVTVIQPIRSPSVVVITWCVNHHNSSRVRRWQWRHTRKRLLHPNLPIWRPAWSTSNHADVCMVLRTISCYMLFARSGFARDLHLPRV